MCGNVVRGVGLGGWGVGAQNNKRKKTEAGWSHGDVRERKRESEKKDKKMRGAFEM